MQDCFALTHTLDLWVGSKGQNRVLSENAHVAYQIKENDTYKNMQTIILSLQAP